MSLTEEWRKGGREGAREHEGEGGDDGLGKHGTQGGKQDTRTHTNT